MLNASLTDHLKEHTRSIHATAEQSGFFVDLLRGTTDVATYVLFLRNLAEVYRALEQPRSIGQRSICIPASIYRHASICSDLNSIAGAAWASENRILPAADRYRARIDALADTDSVELIAHVYVRYLGDLYGGQVIQRRLQRHLGLRPNQLAAYHFDPEYSLSHYRRQIRQVINARQLTPAQTESVAQEAALAFRHNIELSVELSQAANAKNRA